MSDSIRVAGQRIRRYVRRWAARDYKCRFEDGTADSEGAEWAENLIIPPIEQIHKRSTSAVSLCSRISASIFVLFS